MNDDIRSSDKDVQEILESARQALDRIQADSYTYPVTRSDSTKYLYEPNLWSAESEQYFNRNLYVLTALGDQDDHKRAIEAGQRYNGHVHPYLIEMLTEKAYEFGMRDVTEWSFGKMMSGGWIYVTDRMDNTDQEFWEFYSAADLGTFKAIDRLRDESTSEIILDESASHLENYMPHRVLRMSLAGIDMMYGLEGYSAKIKSDLESAVSLANIGFLRARQSACLGFDSALPTPNDYRYEDNQERIVSDQNRYNDKSRYSFDMDRVRGRINEGIRSITGSDVCQIDGEYRFLDKETAPGWALRMEHNFSKKDQPLALIIGTAELVDDIMDKGKGAKVYVVDAWYDQRDHRSDYFGHDSPFLINYEHRTDVDGETREVLSHVSSYREKDFAFILDRAEKVQMPDGKIGFAAECKIYHGQSAVGIIPIDTYNYRYGRKSIYLVTPEIISEQRVQAEKKVYENLKRRIADLALDKSGMCFQAEFSSGRTIISSDVVIGYEKVQEVKDAPKSQPKALLNMDIDEIIDHDNEFDIW